MIAVDVSEKWSDSECILKERQQDLLMDWMQGREERHSGLLQGHLLKWGGLWEEQVGAERKHELDFGQVMFETPSRHCVEI